MKYFDHPEDCEIIRNHPHHKNMAVLFNCDGDKLLIVPAAEWTDHQIFTALNLANTAFDAGFTTGQKVKLHEIRRSLGITD